VPPLWKMQKRTSLTRSLTLTILYSLLYLGYRQRKGMRNLIKWPYRVDKCRHSSTDPRLQLACYIRHAGVAHSLTASISARLPAICSGTPSSPQLYNPAQLSRFSSQPTLLGNNSLLIAQSCLAVKNCLFWILWGGWKLIGACL
jgi:hypothetical protein